MAVVMESHTHTAELYGCQVTITVEPNALREWELEPSADRVQLRTRAERVALCVLAGNGAKAGEVWCVTVLSGEEAVGERCAAEG